MALRLQVHAVQQLGEARVRTAAAPLRALGNAKSGQFAEVIVETEGAGLLTVASSGTEVSRAGKLRTNEVIPGCQKPLKPK